LRDAGDDDVGSNRGEGRRGTEKRNPSGVISLARGETSLMLGGKPVLSSFRPWRAKHWLEFVG